MRGRSRQQLSFGDGFIDPKLFELNDELKTVDKLLSDRTLLQPLEEIFHPTMGAPGTPVDVYVRMLFLKFRYGLSYEEVEQEVRERIPWRFFCHLSLMDDVPDSTTLIKLNQRLGEERIRQLNKRLVKHLVKTKKIKPRKIRIDSTTLETHISYPTRDYQSYPLHQACPGPDGSGLEVQEQDQKTAASGHAAHRCGGSSSDSPGVPNRCGASTQAERSRQ